MNNKKPPLPGLVILAILTAITTIAWVGFEAVRTFINDPEQDVSSVVIEPLDPTLDQEVLSAITQKIFLSDDEIGDTEIVSEESIATQQEVVQQEAEEEVVVEDASESAVLEEEIEDESI